jgi:hypothetical protein
MNSSFPFANTRILALVSVLAALLTFSGCLSSRTLIEDLAKTPKHPVQDSAIYARLNSFQQDFLYLTEYVRESHPEPYGAWSKQEFDSEQRRMLESLASDTGRTVFERTLDSFLSRIRDTHTVAQTSWMGGELAYPISFFWIKDTLFLASVGQEQDTSLIGSRVESFNGVPTNEVFSRFLRFATYENEYRARRIVQYYFVFPTFLRKAGINQSDTLHLTLFTPNGRTREYVSTPVKEPKRFQHYESHPITEKINRPFIYRIVKDDKVCYMQFNTMVDLRLARLLAFPTNLLAYPVAWVMGIGYFENFLEDMCEEMNEEGVKTLVIDMRTNGGGGSIYGEQLLYHLDVPSKIKDYSMAIRFSPFYREFHPDAWKEYDSLYAMKYHGDRLPDSLVVTADFVPDTAQGGYFQNVANPESDYYIEPGRMVFHGKVYVLVGERTYSSAIILSSIIKDNKLFTVVGQPTGGRPSHYGETLILKLPNSGIVCRISCKKFFRPDVSKDSEDSLYPDVEIWPTFDDYKHGRDPVYDWVVQDAARNKASVQ